MSRFWAAGGNSSEDESSDDDSNSSEDSNVNRNDTRWVAMSDDSDSEDEVRVVKSAKDRSLEAFQSHITSIRNAMKIKDYSKIQSEFDELTKAMIKAKQLLAQGIPRPLVRILVDLEDYIAKNLGDKAAFKKLSATQGRALNRMKLTLKKHNKPYQIVMEEYRTNPNVEDEKDIGGNDNDDDDDDDSSDSDSESDSDSDDEKPTKPAAATKKKAAVSDADSSSSSSSDSDSDEDSSKAGSDSSGDDSDAGDDDDDDDAASEAWNSDSEDDSSSDSEAGAYAELKGRARWLKKNTLVKEKVVKNKEERGKMRSEAKAAASEAAKAAEASTATKSILPEVGLTPSILHRKVKEIAASRGRRGTDNRDVLRQLEALSRLSLKFGPRVEIPILMHVITAQFDLQRTLDDYMETKNWKSCATYLARIASVLDEGYTVGVEQIEEADMITGNITVKGKMKAAANASEGAMAAVAADEKLINPHTGEHETVDERAERIRLDKVSKMTPQELKTIPVMGSLALHLSRLEDEYVKSLQHISPHTSEYVTRLRDESKLVELLTKIQAYYERVGSHSEAAALAQLRVEHIYYRHDSIAKLVDRAADFYKKFGEVDMLHPACITSDESGKGGKNFKITHPAAVSGKPTVDETVNGDNADSGDLIAKLCTYVYRYGTDRAKTRAMICHIYHHALHDRFLDARDLLLMSHLQDTIANAGDVSTMILFNRMMVTLGMAAFRLGKIWSAHQCLAEICSGRVRELLAQGVSTGRFNDKSAEQEKAEKRRQVPYHQHINLDLLEACHLISAMLLEIPNMAAASVDADTGLARRARVISRTFRKHHDIYERQVFTGPPEQTRDFVMRASKSLMKGDWKGCSDLLTKLDVWQLVPGEDTVQQIHAMLNENIKLEGLRTYLFAFSAQYDSLSLSQLCAMFEMSKNEVHSVVSKMMINRELFASWDQPTETIVLRKVEPSSLQIMALQFAEKAASLVEANERLLDAQTGSYGYKDGDHHWKDREGQGHGGGGRGYQRGGGRGRGGGGRGGGGRGRGNNRNQHF